MTFTTLNCPTCNSENVQSHEVEILNPDWVNVEMQCIDCDTFWYAKFKCQAEAGELLQ